MSSWHSYPKIYNLGHSAVTELMNGNITVQEKVDGSQFSFGLIDGVMRFRSRGKEIDGLNPEKMFAFAVGYVKSIQHLLLDGYTYRGEYLQTPKHNTLSYDRIPSHHVILFDVNSGEEKYVNHSFIVTEAERLGLEAVPLLYEGNGELLNVDSIKEFMDRISVLGGQKIEGIVIKNYDKFGTDKKVLMGKHVSDDFKEIHAGDWRERNPTKSDLIEQLCLKYATPARWQKAVQHLAEAGKLLNEPKDIGDLIREVHDDLRSECGGEIKEALFAYFFPKIARSAGGGLPQWYKEKLMNNQFTGKNDVTA